jgi:predicted metal-dependent peptidase
MSARLPATISGSVMRLRARCPFFAVLALHAQWVEDPTIGTACTDGERVRFNKEFMAGLTPAHRDFVVAHEVAHVALRHIRRIGSRDPALWNVAADIVVNGLLIQMGLKLAPGGLRDTELEHLRVEDVYARLGKLQDKHKRKLGRKEGAKLRDLLVSESRAPGEGKQPAAGKAQGLSDATWRTVLQRAAVLQRMHDQRCGTSSLGASLEIGELMSPQLDWRTLLWRFLVQTPTDYMGWDRRFIHRGLYLDALEGQSLTVAVCIDTSGSVNAQMLRDFMSELQGILRAYPHVRMKVYFADAALYGPWWVEPDGAFPKAQGGGGTDFQPFFAAVAEDVYGDDPVDLLVYQTDGYGRFPAEEPEVPVLWCVPTGALESEAFPWGEVARLGVA